MVNTKIERDQFQGTDRILLAVKLVPFFREKLKQLNHLKKTTRKFKKD